MDVITKALELGILDDEDAKLIRPEQIWAVRFMSEISEEKSLHDLASQDQIALMHEEISQLNDIIDLEECCRTNAENSFMPESAEISIPASVVSFMNGVVLPILRKVVQKGP